MSTILIAEDDPTVRELVRTILAPLGHEVLAAADGDEAAALLKDHQVVAAVLDVRMPGRTGLDLLAQMRADPRQARAYVVMLTGGAHGDLAERALAAGANRYLTKPFRADALLRAVAQGLELSGA